MGIKPQQIEAGRTILPVHGGIVMVSVLQTMSSVIYSTFLLRQSFPWPASCQVAWRKDELLGLTRDTSAPGVKTQQLVWSRLVSQ